MFVSRYRIQPEDKPAFDEFMQDPFGNHSLRLQRILNLFRGCGESRYALLCIKPHKEWVLMSIYGPNLPIEIHHDVVFNNLADAEREIFARRWKYHTGKN